MGFVYSPQWGGFLTGHGKTTFRGGYRMLYDPPFYNIYLNVATSAPEVFLNSVSAPATHPLPGGSHWPERARQPGFRSDTGRLRSADLCSDHHLA